MSWSVNGSSAASVLSAGVSAVSGRGERGGLRPSRALIGWGFGAIADDLILCLSEALTNAISHAAHGETVTVVVRREDSMVHIGVVDRGLRRPRLVVPAEAALSSPRLRSTNLKKGVGACS
ncbi:ATP-binding protein [Peterkaempfera bronchialis]|uniref:ATP-binding protein n=1 Tax=Peterkaempfera bronchialis TaxID=2126346 RepID=UPI003C308216